MYDAIVLGEALIDFTPCGNGINGNPAFEQNPGGAPANIAVGLSRQGLKTAFMGKVGDDMFGKFLKNILIENNVDVSALILDKLHQTTLAFVHIDETGDREFSFYRKESADATLCEEDIDFDAINNGKLLHFGTVNMTTEKSRIAHMKAAKYAFENGKIVSFDPNLRPSLWGDLNEAKNTICSAMEFAHIVKVSEEEAEFLTSENDIVKAGKYIVDKYKTKILLVTRGKDGCDFFFSGTHGHMDTFDVKVVDTTGAGDSFFAGFLQCVLTCQKSLDEFTFDEIKAFVNFANASGALATTGKGGIPSLPTLKEVENCLNSN